MDLATPSKFWQKLGSEHRADLQEFGYHQVKRRQALRYFTWRWRWSAIRQSEQMRFLLSHTTPACWARCATEPADVSDSTWSGVPWPRRDRWLYVFAVRLLWEYARTHDSLGVLNLPEPDAGSPLPVRWRGRLISQDLANTSLEVAAMARALGGRAPRSILEIGAGYGRTAYALLSTYPECTYTVVDISPSIDVSRWYLGQLFPAERIRFMPPGEAAAIASGSIDLALSISTLAEMTPIQVSGYLQLLDRVAEGGAVYLKQWATWRNPEDGVALTFDSYPIPRRWRRTLYESAPVQTSFRQAVWHVPQEPAAFC